MNPNNQDFPLVSCRALLESGLMDRPFFESNRSLIAEMRLVESMHPDEPLLTEGLGDVAKKALQALIAGGAQYGLGALTLPAAGAGLVVGPTVETIVDGLFTMDSIASAVKSMKDIASMAGEFATVLKDAMSSINLIPDLKFKEFYASINKTLQVGLKLLGKKAEEKVSSMANKLREIVKNMISKFASTINDCIKLLIPDAVIGTTVGTGISVLMQKAADNGYDMLTTVIKKADKLSVFITDPNAAPDFFEDILEKVVKFSRNAADKLEKTSLLKSALMGATGIAVKTFGPKGLRKLADVLEQKSPSLVELVGQITKIVIPSVVTLLAIFQSLMKGDFKFADKKSEKKDQSNDKKTNASNESKSKIAKEEMLMESRSLQQGAVDVERWQKLAGLKPLGLKRNNSKSIE